MSVGFSHIYGYFRGSNMSRLQKRKTESQKSKQKQKQEDRRVKKDNTPESPLPASDTNTDRKKTQYTVRKVNSDANPGVFKKAQDYLREVRLELNKVTWPAKNQTIASTFVVIVLVIIISSFLGLVDVSLKGLIKMVLH